jgi:hypothetical protein
MQPFFPIAPFGQADWIAVLGLDSNFGFNIGGTMTVALFSNNFFPSLTCTWSELIEASFPGYAEQSISLELAQAANGFKAVQATALAEFSCTSEPSAAVWAYGYYLFNDMTQNLTAVARFKQPVPIHNALKILVQVNLVFGGNPYLDDGTGQ